jgi:hypothetical protein
MRSSAGLIAVSRGYRRAAATHGAAARAARQEYGFQSAAAIDDGAVAVHRVQLRAAGHLLTDGTTFAACALSPMMAMPCLGSSVARLRPAPAACSRGRVGGIAAGLGGRVAKQVGVDQPPMSSWATAAQGADGAAPAGCGRHGHHDEGKLGGQREREHEGERPGARAQAPKRASRLRRPRPDSRSLPSFP